MRLAAMLLALGLLASCAQYDAAREANLAAAAQARTASDDATCRASGAQPNSAEYEGCRRRYANQHAQETHRQQNVANQLLNANKIGPIGQ
jgi:hypothetical protein